MKKGGKIIHIQQKWEILALFFSFSDNLPKGLSKTTHTMTLHRLLRNGLTYKRLQVFFESSVSYLDFYERLQELGIDRKAAKSMASRFSSMGLMCKGCREEYDERTGKEDYYYDIIRLVRI